MTDQRHHESLIKTPKQLIVTIVASFLVPIAIIVLLTIYVTSGRKTGAGSDGPGEAATAARIAPLARLALVDPNAPRTLKSGKEVYEAVCTTCHGAGIAGAPKFGDAGAWGPRIAQGAATLYDHAIKGFQGKAGVMPAKGGNPELDDVEVQRAVVYMADAGGAKFVEPAQPAAAPAAAPVAAAAAPAPTADPGTVAALALINGNAKTAAAPAATTTSAAATPTPSAAAPAAATSAPTAVAAVADNGAGKKLYDSICMACHAMGIAGAPKFGDKAAWAPRIAEGLDTLYDHALHGYQGKNGVMPPKGGSGAPDEDVKAAVRYITSAAK